MQVLSKNSTNHDIVRGVGFVGGLSITAMSMSSGFIWASQGQIALVYVAGFFSWTGYLIAHRAATGVFVDNVEGPQSERDVVVSDTQSEGQKSAETQTEQNWSMYSTLIRLRAIAPDNTGRAIGFIAGIAILVIGIAILAWYVRQEHHLLGNLGSGLFLSGYVIAHYFDSGKLL